MGRSKHLIEQACAAVNGNTPAAQMASAMQSPAPQQRSALHSGDGPGPAKQGKALLSRKAGWTTDPFQ